MYQRKGTPEIEVWAEPLTNIPRKTIDSFVVADLLADLMGLSTNSGGIYVRGATGNNWSDWVNIGPNLAVNNVGFMRFDPDSRIVTDAGKAASILSKGSQGGFYALPVTVPRDNIANGSSLSADNTVLHWTPAKGNWKSVRSTSSRYGGSGVGLYCVDSEALIKSDVVPKNTSLRGSIHSLGMGTSNGNREENRLVFGNRSRFSLNLKQGMSPSIEKWGVRPDNSMGWNVLKPLDEAGATNLLGGEYHFNLSFRGGRLVYDLNGVRGWIGNTDESGGFLPLSWDEGPIQFETINSRARLDLAFDEHTTAEGAPIIGTVTRTVRFNGPTRPSSTLLAPICGGYQVGGKCEPTVTTNENDLAYQVVLTPDDSGTLTPFVAQMLLAYSAVWAGGAGGAAINLTPALESADIDLAGPPQQDGSKGEISLSGAMLERKVAGWQNVVQDFCPITIRGRWKDSNAAVSPWANLFFGYQYGINKEVSGWNSKSIRIPINDETIRLRDPAAIIRDNCYPLDLLLANKNSETNLLNAALESILSNFPEGSAIRGISADPFTGALRAEVVGPSGEFLARVPVPSANASGLYGGECVQAILRMMAGPATSNILNGNGDPMRYFPAGHLPIISGASVAGSYLALSAAVGESLQSGSLSNGFMLPPPYGSDALSWIGKFGSDENADFIFSKIGRNLETGDTTIYNGRPYPVYGLYSKFLASNAIRWQFDEKATPDNLEQFLEGFTNQTRPEKNFNEVLVLSDTANSDNSGLYPALRMGMARLGSDNPNAALYSWARTLVVRSNYGFISGGAEVLAYAILRELAAVTAVWPDYTFRGEGFMQPGDLIHSEVLSHTNPSLQNVHFRAQTVRHTITIGTTEPTEWKTTASCQPLSRSQLAALYGMGVPLLASYYLDLL